MTLNKNSREEVLKYWYKNYYTKFTYNISTNFFQKYFHKLLETTSQSNDQQPTLEIAANIGEHLKYVKNKSYYFMVDKNLGISKDIRNIATNYIFANGFNLPFRDNSFERVVITCLLHHVAEPEKILTEVRRILKPNGNLSLFLPCDPGLLFRLTKNIGRFHLRNSPINKLKKLVDAYDHIGNIWSISFIVETIFIDDKVVEKKYPFSFSSYDLNLFSIFQIYINK